MEMNKYIDHTLLKANATTKEIQDLCAEAREHNFKAVCINPSFIETAKAELDGSEVNICTVVGFPLGAMTTESKRFETEDALNRGADEVDMVINISKAKVGDFTYIENEIKSLADACHNKGKILKVIFETCLLTDEEIKNVTIASLNAGADFIKTSTGFSTHGATIEAVKIMKEYAQGKMEIKASGGIRDIEAAKTYIDLGVTRLGTSSGVAIIKGEKGNSSY